MSRTIKTICQFGAGNIGRALVGQIFWRAGWRVVFVDADSVVVDELNRRGGYVIRVKEDVATGEPDAIDVTGVSAVHASDAEGVRRAVREADLLGTAVGLGAFQKVIAAMAPGIAERERPVTVILSENMPDAARAAAETLGRLLPEGFPVAGRVGLVNTSIGKMVPIMPPEMRRTDPTEVWAESYNVLVADRSGFVDEPPEVAGLDLKERFGPWVERKLFVHNLGHAAAAYHGHLAGCELIWQCLEIPEVRRRTEDAMRETARALARRYPDQFTFDALWDHALDLLHRFANRQLGDSVYRVGRDLPRKLAPGDRCIGSLRLAAEEGIEPRATAGVIRAALDFRATGPDGRLFEEDRRFIESAEKLGGKSALCQISGLDPERDKALLDLVFEGDRPSGGRAHDFQGVGPPRASV